MKAIRALTKLLNERNAGSTTSKPQRRNERGDPIKLRFGIPALVAAVTLAGFVIAAFGGANWQNDDLAAVLCLALLAAAAERFDISLYGDSRLSLSFVPMFAAVLVAGLFGLTFVVAAALVACTIGSGRPLHKTAFNFGTWMLAGGASVLILEVTGTPGETTDWLDALGPTVLAALANFFVNTFLVAVAVGLSTDRDIASVWTEKFRWLTPHYVLMGLLGLAIVGTHDIVGSWLIATAFILPMGVMQHSFHEYLENTARHVIEGST